MLFVEFLLTLGLMAAAFPLVYVRLFTPFFHKVRQALQPASVEERETSLERKAGRAALVLGTLLLAALEAYIQTAWSAYCVKRTVALVILPETANWLYYITGFLLCEGALGYIAVKDHQEGLINIFRSVIPMGAFAAFAVAPYRIDLFYGWVARLFGGALWPFS